MRVVRWGEVIEIENTTTKYPWEWVRAPSYFNRCGSISQNQKQPTVSQRLLLQHSSVTGTLLLGRVTDDINELSRTIASERGYAILLKSSS